MRRILALFLIALSACVTERAPTGTWISPTSSPAGLIYANLPDEIDPTGRYIFYLHGKLIEDQGTVYAVSSEFGPYEFTEILEHLARAGFTVISEARTAPTDGEAYAHKIGAHVNALLEAGVPAENITVMGFSKGGGIAILTSAWLQNPDLNFIFIAICHEEFDNNPQLIVAGRILSLYEVSDDYGYSCQTLADRSPRVAAFEEMKFTTGKRHGAFYTADPLWLDPAIDWVVENSGE